MRIVPMRQGFTLIEILIVVLILGILVALGFPSFEGAFIRAQLTQMFLDVRQWEEAIIAYTLEHGWKDGIEIDQYDVTYARPPFSYSIIGWNTIDNMYGVRVYTGSPPGINILCEEYFHAPATPQGIFVYWKTWKVEDVHPWRKYLVNMLKGLGFDATPTGPP